MRRLAERRRPDRLFSAAKDEAERERLYGCWREVARPAL